LNVPHLPVERLRDYASEIAGHVYGHPSKQLWMVGVTGTNGKTSTAQWIAQALHCARGPAAVLGTIGNGVVGELRPSTHTTLDATVLQQTLADLRDRGVQSLAMEVSSHALDQARVAALQFDVAVFTNLTRDHLDYHGSMEAYGAAKARLFRMPSVQWAVINADDEFGGRLLLESQSDRARVLSYGVGQGQVRARNVRVGSDRTALTIDNPCGVVDVDVAIVGAFNVHNLLATFAVLLASGQTAKAAADLLSALQPVRGRMQTLARAPGQPRVVIDYAHTPDALAKALTALRPVVPAGGRLLCVFGCGGDRDGGKRALMGEVAAQGADYTIVTSDNPRGENPQVIIDAIVTGMRSAAHETQVDRRQAIARALAVATVDDVILLAGKGHETTQEIAGQSLPFDDASVATSLLAERALACN
jgi:UDP-N-acetylmuramoyl-L-alanyl-D-glutamate--2,6-diaminopimelate ligase